MFDNKFDIKLNKDSYFIGEKVTGRLVVLTDKNIKAQNVQFYAYGKEEVKFKRAHGEHMQEYSSDDIFFTKDLTYYLKSKGLLNLGNIELPNDVKEIPFEFIISDNAFESYKGKNVTVTYRIYIHAKRKWMVPIGTEKFFIVMSPLKPASSGALRVVSTPRNIIREMNVDGIGLKLELEKNLISPGQTLNGKLSIENSFNQDIRGVKVMLIGNEYVIGFSGSLFKKGEIN